MKVFSLSPTPSYTKAVPNKGWISYIIDLPASEEKQMDINKLSKDQMEVILSKLFQQKTIDKEFIAGTLVANPTNEMKRCTDAMHSLLCKTEHHESKDKTCQYYEEEGLNDCWIKAGHTHWLKNTIDFMKKNEIDDESMLRNTISIARHKAEELMREHPAVRTLLLLLLQTL